MTLAHAQDMPGLYGLYMRLSLSLSFQITESLDLVLHMPREDKIRAVEFWNEISERLQVSDFLKVV